MKWFFLSGFLLLALHSTAQTNVETEKQAVMDKVTGFFIALEKKDTVLYNKLVMPNGQIWTVRRTQDTLKNNLRSFTEDVKKLMAMAELIEERALYTEIKIHNDIAIAWVPYTISIGKKFSHCGVDVFTFLKTPEGWKIVSLAYSIEPGGCAALKKDIQ